MYSIERKFVLAANTQLQKLDVVWGVKPQDSCAEMCAAKRQDCTQSALGAIKSAAAEVKARGIMRSAGFCEDVFAQLKENESAKLQGALVGLKTLVYQYADGLFEIDPAFRDSLQNSPMTNSQKQDNAQTLSETDEKAAHLRASKVLKPLLHLVKTDSRKSALQKIMQATQERETQPMPMRREPVNPSSAIAVKFE
ncbi:MAG: hypothetical protein JKX72_11035, partial [Robiginitomaculum sp.]|nr:hypothetical protein [Robiginitomaculum sp.]